MSLVNAVHELIEVAAGRKNLSAAAADELHAAIDAEQAPPAEPEPEPVAAEQVAPLPQPDPQPQPPVGAPWQS